MKNSNGKASDLVFSHNIDKIECMAVNSQDEWHTPSLHHSPLVITVHIELLLVYAETSSILETDHFKLSKRCNQALASTLIEGIPQNEDNLTFEAYVDSSIEKINH